MFAYLKHIAPNGATMIQDKSYKHSAPPEQKMSQ